MQCPICRSKKICGHKTMGAVIVILLIVVGGYFLLKGGYQASGPTVTLEEKTVEPTEKAQLTTPTEEVSVPEEAEVAPEQPTGQLKDFAMTAKRFSFGPSAITVGNGDTVRLSITSVDAAHGFAINEFDVNVRLSPGRTEIVEFVADKTRTLTFYCSVLCGPGHSGMKGQLIVK